MSAHDQFSVSLHCHPDTPCTAVGSIKASVHWERGNYLTVTYTLEGAVEQLMIQPEGATRRGDDLWRHTCFELFVGAKNDAEYYELNFSPSGEWAAYSFRDYRVGGPCDGDEVEPEITAQRDAASFELSAAIRLDGLSGIQRDFYLWIGLSAVIEDVRGTLSYWALKHPSGKPDFHHPDNFALEFEPKLLNGAPVDDTVKP